MVEDSEFLKEFLRETIVLSGGGCNGLSASLGKDPSMDGHVGLDKHYGQ